MSRTRFLLLAVTLLFVPVPARAADPEKEFKSKDVKRRLVVVEKLSGTLLIEALDDRDWEVVERAATALGERGGARAVKPLLKAALLGPVRRVRLAAARSLAKIDAAAAAEFLAKRVHGELAEAACEALAVLSASGRPLPEKEVLGGVLRGLAAKEVPVRVAAARALVLIPPRDRRKLLESALDAPETSVRAAALDAARLAPDPANVPLLVGLLDTKDLPDVLSRRVLATLVAIVASAEAGEARDRLGRRSLSGSELAGTVDAAARFARLAGMLAERPDPPPGEPGEEDDEEAEAPPPLVDPTQVMKTLDFAVAHESAEVRAAAVHALGRLKTEETLDRAAALLPEDESGRVRLHAMRAVTAARTVKHEGTRDLVLSRLAEDDDVMVREEAAVLLGVRGLSEAVPRLIDALDDAAWEVATCAAISLGKIGDPAAIEPLRELAGHRDWRLRASAVVAFGHLQKKEVVPDIIEALGSRDAPVSRTAWEFLKRMARRDLDPTVKIWKSWWKENEPGFEFVDREAEARKAKKYGYATGYSGVYEDLDVIVLQSRGDNIEKLLDRLAIVHRLTRGGQVSDAGVHPFAVFVSNCTGEIVPKDVEQLAWFVRAGGYLFCSCWALHHTAEKVYPGVVRKLPTSGQVLENVLAEPCPTKSPFLTGVFGDGITRPIYVLYGAHLIEVLDPERVEVLIDSPQCADNWPDGNLACWFTAGHGLILDSANHFDLQGLEKVNGLKSAEDRMAHAMDHMGLGYEELRELRAKKVWNSRGKAAAEARDLSAFRLITNFVRRKRIVDR